MRYRIQLSAENEKINNYNKKYGFYKFIFDQSTRKFSVNWNKKNKLKTSPQRFDIGVLEVNGKGYNQFLKNAKILKKSGGYIHFHMINEIYENEYTNWYNIDLNQRGLDKLFERYFYKESYKQNPQIDASLIPDNIDILSDGNCILVSERFRNICLENNLKGIDFIWVKDVGKYKSRQFFKLVIFNTMGIGLQHPLYDETTRHAYENCPEQIIFIDIFSDKTSEILGDFIKDMRDITYEEYGTVEFCLNERFYKNTLPNTDFAYYNREDGIFYFYISKKALEILKTNGISVSTNYAVIEEDKFSLNKKYLTGGKEFYLEGNIEEKIKISMEEYNIFLKNKKTQKKIDSKSIIKYLKENKKINKKDYASGISKMKTEELKGVYSEDLIKIYSISNGFYLNNNYEVYFIPHELIKEYTSNLMEFFRENQKLKDIFSRDNINISKAIVICQGAGGDHYVMLDNKKILKIDHEEFENYRLWNNIYEFMSSVINYEI